MRCEAEHPDWGHGSLACGTRNSLRVAGEPLLTKTSNAIRFSWLGVFTRPLFIRVAFQPDGTALLRASVTGRSGHEACLAFESTRALPVDAAARLRDEARALAGLPDEGQFEKAERDALAAENEALRKAGAKTESIVIPNEGALTSLLETSIDGRYAFQELHDRRRPQFVPFVKLCDDLLALAQVPLAQQPYGDQ